MRIRRMVPAAALAAMLVPALAGAQWKITTFGGVYAPTTDVAKVSATSGTTSASLALKQKTGFMLGLNANKWLTDRAGFELSGGYVWSDAEANGAVSGAGGFSGTGTESAHLFVTSAKLLLKVTPQNAPAEMYFGVGPALLVAGGKAYQDAGGSKIDRGANVGGVGSFGFRWKLTPAMAFKFGAESYLYSTQLKYVDSTDPTNNYKFDSKFQTDFVVHAGLSFTLPGMSK